MPARNSGPVSGRLKAQLADLREGIESLREELDRERAKRREADDRIQKDLVKIHIEVSKELGMFFADVPRSEPILEDDTW